jgi:hypothetical protein
MLTFSLAILSTLLVAPRQPQPASPLAETLKRVSAIFPTDIWHAEQYPWEPKMLLAAADLVGARPRAEKVLEGWREGQVLFLARTAPPPRKIGIGAVRLASPAAARSYLGLQVDLKRLVDQQLNQPVRSNQSQSIKMKGADEAIRIDRELMVGEDQTITETTLLIRGGDLVVEFLWDQLPADLGWAESVFAHLRRATR